MGSTSPHGNLIGHGDAWVEDGAKPVVKTMGRLCPQGSLMPIRRLLDGIGGLATFFADVYRHRQMLMTLAWCDFRNRYRGSYLGIVWAFIQPLVTIAILWFVFTKAFKAQPPKPTVPFVVWLLVAMAPWNCFADGMSHAASAITGNAFLVKKMSIRLSLMPLVRILSSCIFHLLFLLMTAVLLVLNGVTPSLYWLQALYYLPALVLLQLGLSWSVSALAVFTRDVENALGVVLQFGFWVTPIFWDLDMLPSQYHWLIKLNPVFYIVRGYRDAFIDGVGFWDRGLTTLYFWLVVGFLLACGALVFRRLRSHFADVL